MNKVIGWLLKKLKECRKLLHSLFEDPITEESFAPFPYRF